MRSSPPARCRLAGPLSCGLNLRRIFRSPRSTSNSATPCCFRNSISCRRSSMSCCFIRSLVIQTFGYQPSRCFCSCRLGGFRNQGTSRSTAHSSISALGAGVSTCSARSRHCHHIFNANTKLAGEVDTWFDGDHHPRLQPRLLVRRLLGVARESPAQHRDRSSAKTPRQSFPAQNTARGLVYLPQLTPAATASTAVSCASSTAWYAFRSLGLGAPRKTVRVISEQ